VAVEAEAAREAGELGLAEGAAHARIPRRHSAAGGAAHDRTLLPQGRALDRAPGAAV
jgi:hypothetical protein